MKKQVFIIISVLLFALCGTAVFNFSSGLVVSGNSNAVTFESFSNSVLNLLKESPLEKDCDKVFNIEEDLKTIDNTLMVDTLTFKEITKSNVKLGGKTCEVERNENSVLISVDDNTMLVNNKDIVVALKQPKMKDNKFYFPLQEVAKNLGYQVLETQNKVILSNPFQTKRLIVSSSDSLDSKGAIKKVEGYNNLHIFEYKTEEECKIALNYYNSLPKVDWAEVDRVYSVEDIENSFSDDTVEDKENLNITEYDRKKEENKINHLNDAITNEKENSFDRNLNESNGIKENSNLIAKEENSFNAIASPKSSFVTWGANAMGIESYIDYLSSLGNLNTVIIAVLDTGLDSNHEWFSGRIANGGKNFSTSASTTAYEFEDVEGHGTHVAGTVVDLTLNNVKILPVKVMNDNGLGATSNIILGINYVTNLKKGIVSVSGVDSSYFNNIVAMNLSLGGISSVGSANFNAYNTALNNSFNNGVLPIVAAGNDGIDVANASPANVSCAITVSAVGRAGDNGYYHPYWSNWGQYIDVCAPGEDIISACVGGGTISMDGTSMAAPHIAGVVALLYSSGEFSLSSNGAAEVTNLIKTKAVDLGTIGWDDYFGEGLAYVAYAYAELLNDAVTFSDVNMDHSSSFSLTLSFANSNSAIYYTINGAEPTLENGNLYSGSILINKTQIVRARAFLLDNNNKVKGYSKVSNQIYILNNNDIENAYTVSSSGELISYNGLFSQVTVPTSYNGITINSIGERAFIEANPSIVNLPNSVTTIGRYGFYGCSNLEKVTGNGVTEIGMYAFYFSENLLAVTDNEFPNLLTINKYAFSNCESLQTINLSKVTLVDYFAFCNNIVVPENLTSIRLPSVVTIGDCAFYGSSNLTQVYLPKVEVIGTKAFIDCNIKTLSLPKVKYVGIQCFEDNSNLESADMPELLLVGSQCFYNCAKLENVLIPKVKHIASLAFTSSGIITLNVPELETVGVAAFQNCTKLTNFNVPKLKVIKAEAFYNCRSLKEINLPSIAEIEREAFVRISAATSVTLSPYLKYISSLAFNWFGENCVFYIYTNTPAKQFITNFNASNGVSIKYEEIDKNLNIFNYKIENNEVTILSVNTLELTKIDIPSFIENKPVTKIGANAFKNCNLLSTIGLPNVETIESEAFSGCINLTGVYAPNLKTIGASAFYNCAKLSNITLENSIVIGDLAFNNCTSLKQVKLGEGVTNIGLKALGYANNSILNGFSLIGYEGVAQTYAANNNITFHNVFKNLSRFYFNYYNNNGKTEIYISLVDSYTEGGVIIPSSYTSSGKTYNITKIGDNAFENCVLITDVKLPSTVTTLGDGAFYNCTNLRNINLNYVTNLGIQCFSRCENLQSVTLTKVKEIKPQTFAFCYNLQTINLPEVSIVGDRAFFFCVGLESVISGNLKTIQNEGFANCYKLKNINLNTVTTLGTMESSTNVNAKFTGSVFENCYELGNFVYLANIINLGGQLFSGSGVENLVLGRNFNFYSENYLYRPTDETITIYGYSNTFAQTYANRYSYNFVALDIFSLNNNVELTRTCYENDECILQINAKGLNLKYQWYSYNGSDSILLEGETNNILKVDTSSVGTKKFYAVVTNWDDNSLSSKTFTVTIKPSFEITLVYNENRGKIISSVAGKLSTGQNVTYTIQIFEGCFVTGIRVDGIELNNTQLQQVLNSGYTFTNVISNHTFEVDFGITTYTIIIEYNSNGNVYDNNNNLIISGATITVEHNSTPTFIFTGLPNYHAEQVIVDGFNKGKMDKFTFDSVKANRTLQVNFEINKYTITLNHNSFGSVLSNQSLTDIYDGEARTFTITVEEGYFVESVKCNGVPVSVEDNSFTITNIHSDINLEIVFKEINPTSNIPQGTKELLLFIGIGAAVLIVIFAPIFMFRKSKRWNLKY